MTDETLATPYRGRFAPTPSGLLHMGSLLTAMTSWLQARAFGGRWLLRIDDLDRARCLPGAADGILRQLEAHGLFWDERPRWQSEHQDDYRAALQQLIDQGQAYPCGCTRARLVKTTLPGPDGPVYDGHCRRQPSSGGRCALRFPVPDLRLSFEDGWRGSQSRSLADEVGDFVLLRSDGIIGYQLACAIDEAAQGITEVVRGSDLLGSTFQQLCVMQALQLSPPRYCHGPLLVGVRGLKLSKQNHAPAIDPAQASMNLLRCAQLLSLPLPTELSTAAPSEVLAACLAAWPPRTLLHTAPALLEVP